MAALQGYLLRHKESSQRAMDDIDNLVHDIGSREKEKPKDSEVPTIHRKPREVKPRPVKPLTAEQVDKMYFNPQAGWDKDL